MIRSISRTITVCVCLLNTSIFLLLGGCGTPDKKVLKGTRVPVMLTDQEIRPDPVIGRQKVTLPQAERNRAWPQAGGISTHNMPLVALSAHPKPVWSQSIGHGHLTSGPVIAEGSLFLLNAHGAVVALHADTGQKRWKTPLVPKAFQGPHLSGGGVCYHQNKLYVSTGWGEVVCLNPENGRILWQYMIGIPVRSAPAAHGDRVFIVTAQNELWAFHGETGEFLWTHAGIPEVAFLEGGASPAVRQDLLIAAYTSGEVYALQPENGYPLWSDVLTSARTIDTVSTIAHIRAHPVIVGNTVLSISHGGRARALDARRGDKLWELSIGGIQTPAVFEEYATFVTHDAHCVCVHIPTGKIRWVLPLAASNSENKEVSWAGPVWTQSGLVCLGSQGQILWIDPVQGTLREGNKHAAPFLLPPIVANNTLYTLDDRGVITAWQ